MKQTGKALALADGQRALSPKMERAKKINAFMLHLRAVPNVERAAARAAIPRRNIYFWRQHDEKFKERMDRALAISIERLEEEVFAKSHSDSQVAMWLLRCHKPDPYDPAQKHQVQGLVGGIVIVPPKEDKAP